MSRADDARAAVSRLEEERLDLQSKLSELRALHPAAAARAAKAETFADRAARALQAEMEGRSSLGRTLQALREQNATAMQNLVEARSELDRVVRHDRDITKRLEAIERDLAVWRQRLTDE